jgi:hypothetical protein
MAVTDAYLAFRHFGHYLARTPSFEKFIKGMAQWLIKGDPETDEDEVEDANEDDRIVSDSGNPYRSIQVLDCFIGVNNKVKRCVVSGCKQRATSYCIYCSGNDLGDANTSATLKKEYRENVVAVCKKHFVYHHIDKHSCN